MSDLRQSRQLCCYLVSYGNSAVLDLIMKSEKILYMVIFSILKIDSVTSIETTISDFEDYIDYEESQDNSTIMIEKPKIKNFVIVADTLSFTFNERDCMDSLRELQCSRGPCTFSFHDCSKIFLLPKEIELQRPEVALEPIELSALKVRW